MPFLLLLIITCFQAASENVAINFRITYANFQIFDPILTQQRRSILQIPFWKNEDRFVSLIFDLLNRLLSVKLGNGRRPICDLVGFNIYANSRIFSLVVVTNFFFLEISRGIE